jgi:hypothetical protein
MRGMRGAMSRSAQSRLSRLRCIRRMGPAPREGAPGGAQPRNDNAPPGVSQVERHFRASVIRLCFLVPFVLFLAPCGNARTPERIVLIVVDTLRADVLPPYGGRATAPVIEALAKRGQVFSNAIASFHQTPMSMTAMFTGLTPSIETSDPARPLEMTGQTFCGLTRFGAAADRRGCVPTSVETLGEVLKEAGYWTMGVVSNGLLFAPFGLRQGFDDWVEVGIGFVAPEKKTPATRRKVSRSRAADAVDATVTEVLRRRRAERFFLYVHYMDVHDYVETLDWEREYLEKIPRVDAAIGEVLEELDEEGLLDGAVVIVTSDHGERLLEQHFVQGVFSHGGNPSFEEVLQIPLIIAPPWFDDAASPVRTQDIFSLIERIAGVETKLRPELGPDELYLSEAKWQTYRRGRWKSFLRRSDGAFFLIDLAADPGETRDTSKGHPGVVQEHRERISVLCRTLAATEAERSELSPNDEGRLRALGYLK